MLEICKSLPDFEKVVIIDLGVSYFRAFWVVFELESVDFKGCTNLLSNVFEA
jgi:hypothetical protein